MDERRELQIIWKHQQAIAQALRPYGVFQVVEAAERLIRTADGLRDVAPHEGLQIIDAAPLYCNAIDGRPVSDHLVREIANMIRRYEDPYQTRLAKTASSLHEFFQLLHDRQLRLQLLRSGEGRSMGQVFRILSSSNMVTAWQEVTKNTGVTLLMWLILCFGARGQATSRGPAVRVNTYLPLVKGLTESTMAVFTRLSSLTPDAWASEYKKRRNKQKSPLYWSLIRPIAWHYPFLDFGEGRLFLVYQPALTRHALYGLQDTLVGERKELWKQSLGDALEQCVAETLGDTFGDDAVHRVDNKKGMPIAKLCDYLVETSQYTILVEVKSTRDKAISFLPADRLGTKFASRLKEAIDQTRSTACVLNEVRHVLSLPERDVPVYAIIVTLESGFAPNSAWSWTEVLDRKRASPDGADADGHLALPPQIVDLDCLELLNAALKAGLGFESLLHEQQARDLSQGDPGWGELLQSKLGDSVPPYERSLAVRDETIEAMSALIDDD